MPTVILHEKEPAVPDSTVPSISKGETFPAAMENQHKWLEHVYNVHETEQDMRLSWSVFYAAEIEDSHPVAICTMLPHLKATARTKRGKGIRRRVDPSNRLPGNWGAFLKNDHNKEELFRYIAQLSVTVNCEDKEVSSTMDSQVLCSIPRNLDGLSPCTHEKADTRLLLHAADCAQHGHKKNHVANCGH